MITAAGTVTASITPNTPTASGTATWIEKWGRRFGCRWRGRIAEKDRGAVVLVPAQVPPQQRVDVPGGRRFGPARGAQESMQPSGG